MKNLIKAFIFADLLLIFFPLIFSFGIRLIPANYQPSLDYPQKVFKSTDVTQTFIASKDNLAAVGVSIKNPNLLNKQDISMILMGEASVDRKVTLNGQSIEDGGFVKFVFSPILDSKNKKYTFQFSSPNSEKNESLEIFITNRGIAGQDLLVGGEKRAGAISFVDFYKPDPFYLAPLVIYEDLVTRLLADLLFAVFYSCLLFFLAGGIIFYFFRKR